MKGKIAYVVADLEGSTGAWTKAHTLGNTPQWQEARLELTRDINAVADALFDRGVKGVVVKDFHRTGYNLIPTYLDKRIKLVSGYYTGPAIGYGKLHRADFALFVGLHASGGNENGFLAHTLTSRIAEIRVNGKRVCEAELFATVLSGFHVPTGFFSGCPAACQEATERMKWVITFPVGKDPHIYQDDNKRKDYIGRMRNGLREKIKEMPDPEGLSLFFMKAPFDCRVIFHETEEARRINSWGFAREGRTIHFYAAEFLELYQNLLKIAYFSRATYSLRHLLIPLTRVVWKLQARKHL
jgi:D-amino peptidase